MSDELEPLPSDIAAALGVERARPGLSSDAHARLEARIGTALSAAVSPSPASSQAPVGVAASKLGAAVVASLLAGGAVGGGAVYALRPAPEPVVIEKVVVKEVRVEVPAPTAPHVGLPVEPVPAPLPTVKRPPPSSSDDAALAEERALVEAARVALTRGRPAEALEGLAEHQRRFLKGRLAEERESLAIQALLASGKADEAKARATKFRASYPTSLLLPLIDRLLSP